MDDTTRGLVNESMSGRGEEPPPEHASGPESRPDSDQDTHRRTREIRAEIEHTREEMSETIDAIQERLRPGNIVAGAAERVREATTEGVRNMAESASETAKNAMEKTREMTGDVAEFGRENAIPAALIGSRRGVAGYRSDPRRPQPSFLGSMEPRSRILSFWSDGVR